MDTHKNAPLTPKGREAMVRSVIEGDLTKAAAAPQFNISAKTVAKWVKRFREEGVDGLRDRSSRPLSSPSQTLPATCAEVEALRRQRHTGKQIAAEVGISPATVSRILRRLGLNRLRDLEPAEPVRRYEREHPGELIHIDIKKLGKFNRIPSHHRRSNGPEQPAGSRRRARLGIRPRLHRRCLPHCLQQSDEERATELRRGLPQGCDRLLLKPRHQGRAGHDRQRILLQILCFPQSLQAPRPQAYPHQALHAEDQRQGRALYPDQPARMGLCPRLQHFKRTSCRVAEMASPLQLAPAAWQYRLNATHQQTRSN